MTKSFSLKFFLDKYNPNTEKYKIYLRITVDRQKAEIALQHSIHEKEWDSAKQRAKRNKLLNEELASIEYRIFEIRRELDHQKKRLSAKAIKDIYTGKTSESILLTSYLSRHIEYLNKSGEHTESTIENYEKGFKHLERFISKMNVPKITLPEIDFKFICDLDAFLISYISTSSRKKLKRNYINKLHERFRTVLNKAIKEDVIVKNPYVNFKLKYENNNERKYLTKEEIDRINASSLNDNISLQNVRDIFLFSVYTGLRFSDATSLKCSDIVMDKGRLWIYKKQVKTENPLEIPLLKSAESLYHKFSASPESKITGLLLPKISNQKVNSYLKAIADLCHINMKITHHVARHTCATTILSDNGIREEDISKILGHTNTKTTQIYRKTSKVRLENVADVLYEKFN